MNWVTFEVLTAVITRTETCLSHQSMPVG
jgi:hypothetical protein